MNQYFKIMRKLLLLSLIALSSVAKSQDTLYVKTDSVIKAVPCKIIRIQQGKTMNSTRVYYMVGNVNKDISLSDIAYYKLQSDQMQIQPSLSREPIKDRLPKTLSERTSLSSDWLVFSGVSIIASGLCNMISANKKAPNLSSINYANDIADYNKSQKNLHNISSGLGIISGISLIIGVKIYFK